MALCTISFSGELIIGVLALVQKLVQKDALCCHICNGPVGGRHRREVPSERLDMRAGVVQAQRSLLPSAPSS